MSPAEIYYRQELDAASLQTASADRVLRRVAWLRLLIIGVAIVVLLMRRSSADAELWSIAALATLMFNGAVWWHRRLRAEAEHWRQRSAAAVATTDRSSLLLSQLGRACARAGHRARAMSILYELDERNEASGPAAYYGAEILAALGGTELALDRLYAAYRQRNPFLVFAGVLYGLDPLRGTRRFRDLLMRIGLPAREHNPTRARCDPNWGSSPTWRASGCATHER